jgi:hypothetical protein
MPSVRCYVRPMRKRIWMAFGVSVLVLLAAVGIGFYGGWGPCGPSTVEGMLLMIVGILGVLGSGVLLIGSALLGFLRHVWQRSENI